MKPCVQVVLANLHQADAPDLFSLWSDHEIVKFTNWPLLTSQEECAQRLERMFKRYAPGSQRIGPFVIRSEQDAFVGLIAADVTEPFKGEHEVWYLLHRTQWGQGFGTQAVGAFVKLLAASNQVTKAVATAVTKNTASWKVLEKNGFSRTGVIPGGFTQHGLTLDLFEYERAITPA